MRTFLSILLAVVLAAPVAKAQDGEAALALFEAYQSGYLQLAAVSCFQLYAASGVVTTDFLNGFIDAGTATQALDHNRLLLSTGITTLENIRAKTPEEDLAAHAEFGRLSAMFAALQRYMDAVEDFVMDPTEPSADAADAAQAALDRAMEEFAGPQVE
jgi:hypothetical protein